jgi:phospholipid transport system substrate-binding protein
MGAKPAEEIIFMGRSDFHFFRLRAFLAAFFAMMLVAAPAMANAPAEAFVQQNVQKGLVILNNHSIPDAQRRSQFRDFLTSLTDIRRIALFTLGAERRTAAPGDVEAFVNAFRNYAVAVYESRLTQYSGQYLRVTGSTERAPGDDIVSTVLVDPSGKSSGEAPIEVDFRVLSDNGRLVVTDVSIAGVWLALEERDQFAAFLQQNNGNVSALTAHLQQMADQIRNGVGQQSH